MTGRNDELLVALELHSVERIQALLDAGLDVRAPVRGERPVNWLTERYTRSDRFPDCLRLVLERGAVLDDPAIAPVLLDDAESLAGALRANPALLEHRTTMVSAFTPLVGASLLHVAAEYGHVKTARVLVERGADIGPRSSIPSALAVTASSHRSGIAPAHTSRTRAAASGARHRTTR